MRGNSQRFERDAVGGQNASDAGPRALHKSLSAGNGGTAVSCIQARAQLAAYRRDDWSASEMRALSEHLASCAACRQVEFSYRQVGESLRLLPTMAPDRAFRDRVFAAIAADQQRLGPAALRASRATTEPSLPVVRAPVPDVAPHRRRPGPLTMGALAAAAVLVLSLVTMQWLSARANNGDAANISHATPIQSTQTHLASYLPDQRFYQITSVSATQGWLAYVASDGAGSTMLFVIDRRNGASHKIFVSPASGAVTLIALTSQRVVWSVSSSVGWTVAEASLTGSTAWKSQIISQDTTSTLTGDWADDSQALVATSDGDQASLTQYSLTTNGFSRQPIAKGSHTGALITNPSVANGVTYWADVWADDHGALHSAVWAKTAAGANPVAQAGGEAYAPVALNGALLWVNATHTLSVSSGSTAAAIATAAAQASGKLIALDLKNGTTQTLAPETLADTVHAGGTLVLWSDSATMQSYDLSAHHSASMNALITHAQIIGAGSGAVSWFDGSHIVVYSLN
jgi:hypothetical protein